MTRAEFEERYHLVRKVTDGPVVTYHAVAKTGAVVMVHMLDPHAQGEPGTLGPTDAEGQPATPDQPADLLRKLDSLDTSARERVLESTEVDGRPVLVTRFLLEFETLEDWLRAHVEAPGEEVASSRGGEEPSYTPPPLDTRSDPPGEFTRMFALQEGGQLPTGEGADGGDDRSRRDASGNADGGTGRDAEEAPTHRAPAPSEPDHAPGEFTRMFKQPDTSDDPRGEASRVDSDSPGEFTRMIRGQNATPPGEPAPSTPSPPPLPPAPATSSSPPPPAPAAPPAPLSGQDLDPNPLPPYARSDPPPHGPLGSRPRASGPGEFTRWFARQTGGPSEEPAIGGSGLSYGGRGGGDQLSGARDDDWLSRLGAVPHPPGRLSERPVRREHQEPEGPFRAPAPPAAAGPGEYTRIVSRLGPREAAGQPRPTSPVPQPPKYPHARKAPSRAFLFVGLAAVLVLTIAAVVLFAVFAGRGAVSDDAASEIEVEAAGMNPPAANASVEVT